VNYVVVVICVSNCVVLMLLVVIPPQKDTDFAKHTGYVPYDFKFPSKIPKELQHTFDYVIADPPFITCEVWEQFAISIKLLLVQDNHVKSTNSVKITANKGAQATGTDQKNKPKQVQPERDHICISYGMPFCFIVCCLTCCLTSWCT